MTLKISCKFIGDDVFDITVGQEMQTISRENNQAVFKLSEIKNYDIKICQKLCKSNHTFGSILFFFFTMIFQGVFNIILMNTDSKWYEKLNPYVIKTDFNVFINDDKDLEFIYNKGYFYYDRKIKKLPKIKCNNINSIKTDYDIDKVNLTNAYFEYVKKFISCASICELMFLLLLLVGIINNNFIATIVCGILFTLVLIIQTLVLVKEFMRLKKICDELINYESSYDSTEIYHK